MYKQIYKLALLLTFAAFFSCTENPTIAGGGSDTENGITGSLYQTNGAPASGVTVTLYSANYTPLSKLDMAKAAGNPSLGTAVTDSKGQYRINLPVKGTYNIIGAANDNRSVFIDSVVVPDTSSVYVDPDTIRASGGIHGFTYLVGKDSLSQIRVTLYLPGTGFLVKPNIGGEFSFANVPSGKYRLYIDPTFTEYQVKFLNVEVKPNQITNLDTINIYSNTMTGIPSVYAGQNIVSSLKDTLILHGIASDEYGKIVRMEWDVGNTGVFKQTLTGDTTILPVWNSDSSFLCIFRAIDNDSIKIADTLIVNIINDAPVISGLRDTIVGINDVLVFVINATDSNGIRQKYYWNFFDGSTNHYDTTIAASKSFQVPAVETVCSISVMVSDSLGKQSIKSSTIRVLRKPPTVNAGSDLAVYPGDTIHLRGSGSDETAIVKYEWKIGNGNWGRASSADTSFIAPLTIQTFTCSIRVTDDDNNIAIDGTIVGVYSVIDIDGNGYHTVKIGNQEWMVENLKTTKLNDGTSLMYKAPIVGSDSAPPGYWWPNNDSTTKDPYGALYNWYACGTNKLAPKGWRIPSDSDWAVLFTFLGGIDRAGSKLREVGTEHWTLNSDATNEVGFTALPAGNDNGRDFGLCALWWSSTRNWSTDYDVRYQGYYYTYSNMIGVGYWLFNANFYHSVRCIKD